MTQLRSGDDVLVVHPFGVAHRAYILSEERSGYSIQWIPPLPGRSPVLYHYILKATYGITWLLGYEHSAEAVDALCAAAALARGGSDA